VKKLFLVLKEWVLWILMGPDLGDTTKAYYTYWEDDSRWTYALVGGNNRLMSMSTQSYASRGAVLRAISQHRSNSITHIEIEKNVVPKE